MKKVSTLSCLKMTRRLRSLGQSQTSAWSPPSMTRRSPLLVKIRIRGATDDLQYLRFPHPALEAKK